MSDHESPKDTDPNMSKSPPPAYSEVSSQPVNPQGGPAPVAYPAPPPAEQGYPQPPYNQPPYMQGYQYPPGQAPQYPAGQAPQYPPGQAPQYPAGQAPPEAGKNPEMVGSPYPPGQYPPSGPYPAPGQYPPGQYPPGPPVYSQGQPFPAGTYPPGPYTQVPYGHPTAAVVVTQPTGATLVVAQSPPPDNMILSWLACLFCFCPIGFFAVIYSWQAKCANETNDFQAAAKYGSKAKRLAITSIIFGILVFIVCIILRLIIYTSYPTASY